MGISEAQCLLALPTPLPVPAERSIGPMRRGPKCQGLLPLGRDPVEQQQRLTRGIDIDNSYFPQSLRGFNNIQVYARGLLADSHFAQQRKEAVRALKMQARGVDPYLEISDIFRRAGCDTLELILQFDTDGADAELVIRGLMDNGDPVVESIISLH